MEDGASFNVCCFDPAKLATSALRAPSAAGAASAELSRRGGLNRRKPSQAWGSGDGALEAGLEGHRRLARHT